MGSIAQFSGLCGRAFHQFLLLPAFLILFSSLIGCGGGSSGTGGVVELKVAGCIEDQNNPASTEEYLVNAENFMSEAEAATIDGCYDLVLQVFAGGAEEPTLFTVTTSSGEVLSSTVPLNSESGAVTVNFTVSGTDLTPEVVNDINQSSGASNDDAILADSEVADSNDGSGTSSKKKKKPSANSLEGDIGNRGYAPDLTVLPEGPASNGGAVLTETPQYPENVFTSTGNNTDVSGRESSAPADSVMGPSTGTTESSSVTAPSDTVSAPTDGNKPKNKATML